MNGAAAARAQFGIPLPLFSFSLADTVKRCKTGSPLSTLSEMVSTTMMKRSRSQLQSHSRFEMTPSNGFLQITKRSPSLEQGPKLF